VGLVSDLTEPTHICVVCQYREYDDAQVCAPCRHRLDVLLAEIAELWPHLPAELMPGSSMEPRVSGSREAQLPVRVDVLDLTMPAHQGSRAPMVRGAMVRDWITYVPGDHVPASTVPEMVAWLRVWLTTACDGHPAVDEFADTVDQVVRAIRRALGLVAPKPVLLHVPCPSCNLVALYRHHGDDRTYCGSCGRIMDPELYERLITAMAAELRKVA
jgi:ribosomal protein S27AE